MHRFCRYIFMFAKLILKTLYTTNAAFVKSIGIWILRLVSCLVYWNNCFNAMLPRKLNFLLLFWTVLKTGYFKINIEMLICHPCAAICVSTAPMKMIDPWRLRCLSFWIFLQSNRPFHSNYFTLRHHTWHGSTRIHLSFRFDKISDRFQNKTEGLVSTYQNRRHACVPKTFLDTWNVCGY